MVDVFISYKREERSKAEALAKALVSKGYVTWWDANILSFEGFEEQIESAIDKASVSVILWSNKAVQSKWVKLEATYADNNNKPIVHTFISQIDTSNYPMRFIDQHFHDLSNWDETPGDPTLDPILESIEQAIGQTNNESGVVEIDVISEDFKNNLLEVSSDKELSNIMIASIEEKPEKLEAFLDKYDGQSFPSHDIAENMLAKILNGIDELKNQAKPSWKTKANVQLGFVATVLTIVSFGTIEYQKWNTKNQNLKSKAATVEIPNTDMVEQIQLCDISLELPPKSKIISHMVEVKEEHTVFEIVEGEFEIREETIVVQEPARVDATFETVLVGWIDTVETYKSYEISNPKFTKNPREHIFSVNGDAINYDFYSLSEPGSYKVMWVPPSERIKHTARIVLKAGVAEQWNPGVTRKIKIKSKMVPDEIIEKAVPAQMEKISTIVSSDETEIVWIEHICDVESHPELELEVRQKVDAKAGERTSDALLRFQEKYDLHKTGNLTIETIAKMDLQSTLPLNIISKVSEYE